MPAIPAAMTARWVPAMPATATPMTASRVLAPTPTATTRVEHHRVRCVLARTPTRTPPPAVLAAPCSTASGRTTSELVRAPCPGSLAGRAASLGQAAAATAPLASAATPLLPAPELLRVCSSGGSVELLSRHGLLLPSCGGSTSGFSLLRGRRARGDVLTPAPLGQAALLRPVGGERCGHPSLALARISPRCARQLRASCAPPWTREHRLVTGFVTPHTPCWVHES